MKHNIMYGENDKNIYIFQALKIAFPTGTFLKNGIVQGIKVSSMVSFSLLKYYLFCLTWSSPFTIPPLL